MQNIIFPNPFTCLSRLAGMLLLSLFCRVPAHAAIIKSANSGNWTSGATWIGGVVPNSSDDVVIQSGHTVSRNTVLSFQKKLTVDGTFILSGNIAFNFNSNASVIVNGEMQINGAPGSFYCPVSGTGTMKVIGGITSINNAAWSVKTTWVSNGELDVATAGLTFKDLSLGGSGNAVLKGSAAMKVTGTMQWKNGGIFRGTNGLTIDAGSALNATGLKHYNEGSVLVNGTFTAQDAEFGVLNNTTGTLQIAGNGTVDLNGAATIYKWDRQKVRVNGYLGRSGNAIWTLQGAGAEIKANGELRLYSGINNFDCNVGGNGVVRHAAGGTPTSNFSKEFSPTNTVFESGTAKFSLAIGVSFYYLALENAQIIGNAPMHVFLEMDWKNGGRFAGTNGLSIESSGWLFFTGANHYNDGALTNYGTVKQNQGKITRQASAFGTILNSGNWEDYAPVGATHAIEYQNFKNLGTLWCNGNGEFLLAATSTFDNPSAGQVRIEAGKLRYECAGPTQSGHWHIRGELNIENAAQQLNFAGHIFDNTGNVTGDPLCFTGTAQQTWQGDGNIDAVKMDKPANLLFLQGNLNITGALNLISGHIQLNDYDVVLDNATIYNGSDNSYLLTNGLGGLVRSISGTGNGYIPFQVGNNGYAPANVGLGIGSVADQFRVRVQAGIYGELDANDQPMCTQGIPEHAVNHTWIVEELVPGGSVNGRVGFMWNSANELSGFDRSHCAVSQFTGGNWSTGAFTAASSAGGTDYYQLANGFSTFGPFAIFDEAGLPNLEAPTAASNSPVPEGTDIKLSASFIPQADYVWSGPVGFTAAGMQVQRPNAKLDWSGSYCVRAMRYGCVTADVCVGVEVIPAAPMPFSDTENGDDEAPSEAGERSETVTGTAAGLSSLCAFPNPATHAVTLRFETARDGEARVLLTDLRGNPLHQSAVSVVKGSNDVVLPLGDFPSGIYQATLQMENEVKTTRVVKVAGE